MSSKSKGSKANKPEWIQIVSKYQKPHTWKSVWQIINTTLPYLVLWYLMYRSLAVSYWITLGLAVITAGLHARVFIIQHDCGHNSFFKSRKANNIIGAIFGVVTLTPYAYWRKTHAMHHATSGDLDFRGPGDIDTLTVQEYLDLDWKGRLRYRLFRNPIVMFVIGPTLMFALFHRIPVKTPRAWKRERRSVYLTNLGIAAVVVAMGLLVGFKEFFLVQGPVIVFASTIGVWLFYVQHQFEDTYWRRHPKWDYKTAALQGSSYFKLPAVLQWFSGNIGFHHIHHLSPLIPNYKLQEAFEENEMFQEVETVTIFSSFKTIFLNLWDEESKRLVSFAHLKKMKANTA
ncbi:MAG: fatty acid desaturase [Anaerolineae bacterium]|nr:fatty acid desaturase [Anaerolineae bacterium]